MIFNMNAGEGKKVPVLKDAYPQNITVTAGDNATFVVLVEEEGKPAGYTYTWYVNGSVVEGAKSQNYIRDTSEDKGVLTVYCEVTNKAGTVTSRTASLTLRHNITVNTNPGATVAATSGSDTVSATADSSGEATLNLKDGNWTITATSGGATASAEVTVDSHKSISLTANRIPAFTYSGSYKIVDDSGNTITGSPDNWRIRFLTSGTLKFTDLNGAADGIDVFCCGGGGDGGQGHDTYDIPGAGGGGGYTKTLKGVSVATGTSYSIKVGGSGGKSSGFGCSASGGSDGTGDLLNESGHEGGDGGSGGNAPWATGTGGTDGGNGTSYSNNGTRMPGGSGQGSTTREFGESSGTLYATGGSGGSSSSGTGKSGAANTGNGGKGGGGAGAAYGGSGGSGIVVIRNKR